MSEIQILGLSKNNTPAPLSSHGERPEGQTDEGRTREILRDGPMDRGTNLPKSRRFSYVRLHGFSKALTKT